MVKMFFRKTPAGERAFEDESLLSKRRRSLIDNLDKLSVSPGDKKSILDMRDALPDFYHEMPLKAPSQCFSLFENSELPKRSWLTEHHIDTFQRCKDSFLQAIDEEKRSQKPS